MEWNGVCDAFSTASLLLLGTFSFSLPKVEGGFAYRFLPFPRFDCFLVLFVLFPILRGVGERTCW
ncbi:hypothetical protein CABS01_03127 [Colletotrichum abscissum]|uniref:uncharacterized protein n=1 Tax=Colletotrichum abscissum TaxID=1671311 RepID=UPI0027D4DA4F|nr:uncharacterized protein CABS01_03127 [Colletotrichum abscissum]KAK1477825.1 hypothetical protein CABS01_03127 [Colletotrichum abscissum]